MSGQKIKRRVGKYDVGRTIGEGTFAKVKFTRNSQTGEPVALKILDKEKVLKCMMAEQIRREISTMKLIKHPNAVQLYEVMGSKTKIYIILEFATGGELFDKVGFKREIRFTSKCPANEIIKKIEEAAKPLCFDVQKKNFKTKLENVKAGRKGNLNVATKIFQVAPSLHVVKVHKAKGDTWEFLKFYKKLSTHLEDVVWKTEE